MTSSTGTPTSAPRRSRAAPRRAGRRPPGLPALAPVMAAVLVLASSVSWTAAAAWAAMARTTLPAVEGQVMCVTCKIPLPAAQSLQATRERAYIQSLIDQGRSDTQIKRALVYQYGPAVLALPSAHGFDLAAYLVPVAVVAALLIGLALLLPRWRRRTRAAQAARGAPVSPLSPADTARLEADMARFD
jgi:cytochrome c-type biogenesis protein CcmH